MGLFLDILQAEKGDSLLDIFDKNEMVFENDSVFYDAILLAATIGVGTKKEVKKIYENHQGIERGTIYEAFLIDSYTEVSEDKANPSPFELIHEWKNFIKFDKNVKIEVSHNNKEVVLKTTFPKKININKFENISFSAAVAGMPQIFLKQDKNIAKTFGEAPSGNLREVTGLCTFYQDSAKSVTTRIPSAILAAAIAFTVFYDDKKVVQIHTLWEKVISHEKGAAIRRSKEDPTRYKAMEKFRS